MECKHDNHKGSKHLISVETCPHKKKVLTGLSFNLLPKGIHPKNQTKCEYQEICKHFEQRSTVIVKRNKINHKKLAQLKEELEVNFLLRTRGINEKEMKDICDFLKFLASKNRPGDEE